MLLDGESTASTVTQTTDYVGNKLFENNVLDRIFVDGGYIKNDTYYFYETDHLGSNRLTVSQTGTASDRSDYYPYGMQMAHNDPNQGATQQIDGYAKTSFKFNGKELDVMHGLNLYDSQARMQDPTLGRFTTVDPMAEKYYNISPYAYCGDNPVNAIDINGDTITTMIDGQRYYYGAVDGKSGFIGVDGTLYSGDNIFVNRLTDALSSLKVTKDGSIMINQLQGSKNVVTIVSNAIIDKLGLAGGNGFKAQNSFLASANLSDFQAAVGNTKGSDGSGGTVYWNPLNNDGGIDVNGNTSRPAAIGLSHELAHARDADLGRLHYFQDLTNPLSQASYQSSLNGLNKSEWSATTTENIIRSQFSPAVPLRAYYGYAIDLSAGIKSPIGPRLLVLPKIR
jgi:RHS repeat-associated protein